MATAQNVADYFLAVAPDGDITNLKLQKLCAYAQAISLGFLHKTLFDEDIEAWTHGPVIPSLYQEFKTYGNAPIPAQVSQERAIQPFNQQQRYVLQMTWVAYGKFAPWALREQSHWDFPGDFESRGSIISKKDIEEVFKNSFLVKKMQKNENESEVAHSLEV